MPTMWKRDFEEAREKLTGWVMRKLPGATEVGISELVEPQTSGFSNETLLCDLSWKEGGEAKRESLVIRVQPTGFTVFPEYDLGLQYRTMSLLGAAGVPVPPLFWLESDDVSLLGAPFYVMGRVEGRVPPDNPPYHVTGWVTEISPAERAAIWWSGVEALAMVHRLDYRAAGFAFLEQPEQGATPLEWQLRYYDRYLAWAARGKAQPIAERAREWLWKNMPEGEPTCLQWGDARIGNIIFADTRPAAVLDWEMVTLGSPEADLAWSIFLDRHHSEGLETPRLEGFPSYDETVARYQELTGHRVRHLHYYQVFAGYRFAVIMMRIAQQMVHYGLMDGVAGYDFEIDNTVTRLLAKLLERR
jgi:aminoglycoside phosphotransferase (APT) family kinase protein